MTVNRFNFKVWLKKEKRFINELVEFQFYENNLESFTEERTYDIPEIYKCAELDYSDCVEMEEYYYNIEDCIVVQSTNLTDKNGKEIFEGDILRDGDDIIVVSWSNTWSKFVVSYIDGEEEYQNMDFENLEHPICNFKIIGNIYQNKELLKN